MLKSIRGLVQALLCRRFAESQEDIVFNTAAGLNAVAATLFRKLTAKDMNRVTGTTGTLLRDN